MELSILKAIKPAVNNWRTPLFLGVFFLFSGMTSLFVSMENEALLFMLFGTLILVSGLGEMTFAFLKRQQVKGWIWFLAAGFADLLIGILFLYNVYITTSLISLYLAFWLLFRSMMAIGVSFRQQASNVLDWQWLLIFVLGAFFIAFSILMNTIFDGFPLLRMLTLSYIVLGFFRVIIAIGLKQIQSTISGS